MFKYQLEKAIKWLFENQNADGGWGGPFPDRQLSGAWTTAGVILALTRLEGERSVQVTQSIARAIEWLKRHQNPDGGWPRVHTDVSGTEATSWACMAFSHSEPDSETLLRGINWLIGSQNPQDGGWDYWFTHEKNSKTIPTCFAIMALAQSLGKDSPSIKKALRWIHHGQQGDGGWGLGPGSVSDPMSTALSLRILVSSNSNKLRPITRGTEHLKSKQLPDGSWQIVRELNIMTAYVSTEPEVTPIPSLRDVVWTWFSTPFAISALISAGESVGTTSVQHGLDNLLGLQSQTGGWRYLGSANPLSWATYQATISLKEVEESLSLERDYFVLTERIESLTKYVKTLESSPVLVEEHKALAEELQISKPSVIGKRTGLFLSRRAFSLLAFGTLLGFFLFIAAFLFPSQVSITPRLCRNPRFRAQ